MDLTLCGLIALMVLADMVVCCASCSLMKRPSA